MRDFVFMIDMNGDINAEYAKAEDIKIFPQYYHFNDGIIYGDGKYLDMNTFFSRLRAGEKAYSMGCNPERVKEIMEPTVAEGKDVIVAMASSECSGSYNTVRVVAQELMEKYPGSRIYVLDSLLECAPIGLLVRMGVDMKKAGKSFDEIVETLERRKLDMDVYFIVDNLEYLVRGGRLSAFKGAVGSMLDIKPILHFENGKIVPLMKCRGKKAAKQIILERLSKMDLDPEYFAFGNTTCREEVEEYAEECKEKLGVKITDIVDVNLIISTHTGDGAFGVTFVTKDKH